MRIAFVLARFGEEVLGGAERLGKGLAIEAKNRGWDVEVWTTSAVDVVTWENTLEAGTTIEDGLVVRRFPVDTWDPAPFHRLNEYRFKHLGLSVEQQYEWVESGPHSSALNDHVRREAAGFDAVVVMPYLSSINYDVILLTRERAILWPCLHDEALAHMEPFCLLLELVRGVVFLSPEEARFAIEDLQVRLPRQAIIGGGLDPVKQQAAEFGQQEQPYLLYVGRLEHAKNLEQLYEYVDRYVREGGNLRLVAAGDGPLPPPSGPAFEYVGRVSEEEKHSLMAGALAVCQPSFNESFSLVVMESWLARRPALVWSGCKVTTGHVQRSKGGLWFGNFGEFKAVVDWLLENEEAADQMGENGRKYVEKNFTWDRVVNQFEGALRAWNMMGSSQHSD